VSEGDLVLEVNQRAINAVADYEKAMAAVKSGDRVLLLLKNRRAVRYVAVTLP